MKKSLLFLVMVCAMAAHAQVVNIPDAAFKQKLLDSSPSNEIAFNTLGQAFAVDANANGEIEVAEAVQVGKLFMASSGITSLQGIASFVNLTELDVKENTIASVALNSLDNLQIVNLRLNSLTQLDVSGMASIKELYCEWNDITAFSLIGCTTITLLDIYQNPLTSLNLQLPNLIGLQCHGCQLTSLDVSGLPSLFFMNYGQNMLTEPVDFSNNPNIFSIDCSYSNFSTFNYSGLTSLYGLSCDHNLLTEINVAAMPNLKVLNCSDNPITHLDLSQTVITHVIAASMPSLESINVKNGQQLVSFSVYGSTSLVGICADEEEIMLVQQSLQNDLPNSNVSVNSYCSPAPGGDYNTISGNIRFDADNNGCDTNDIYMPFIKTTINDGQTTGTTFSTYSNGYSFFTQEGTFTITPQFENDWFIASPATATATFSVVDNSVVTHDFCIAANGVHNDAEVAIVPVSGAQPGFDAYYKVVYSNRGNQVLNGGVSLNFNDSVLDFVESSETGVLTEGHLVWAYSNLLPFETRVIDVVFNVNGPMETPAVNIGDQLEYDAAVTPLDGDETPANNLFGLKQQVAGAYDPNDIACLEGAYVNPELIGGYLHYNINFENTGNAPATFVVVKDMIDAEKYDIGSLQVLYASHQVETRLTGNKLEFIFDNIGLAANGGKGNVLFKIKTLNALQTGDDVMQEAEIYFDYNWPVQTNEAVTVFDVLGLQDYALDKSVAAYPNPTNGIVNITSRNVIQSVNLYDVQGRLLQTELLNHTEAAINISQRASGIYFIKVYTGAGVRVEKIVKE